TDLISFKFYNGLHPALTLYNSVIHLVNSGNINHVYYVNELLHAQGLNLDLKVINDVIEVLNSSDGQGIVKDLVEIQNVYTNVFERLMRQLQYMSSNDERIKIIKHISDMTELIIKDYEHINEKTNLLFNESKT